MVLMRPSSLLALCFHGLVLWNSASSFTPATLTVRHDVRLSASKSPYDMDMSNVNLPKVEMPKVDMPKVEMPKMDMPKMDMPKMEMPQMPSMDMPTIEMPQIDFSLDGMATGLGVSTDQIMTQGPLALAGLAIIAAAGQKEAGREEGRQEILNQIISGELDAEVVRMCSCYL